MNLKSLIFSLVFLFVITVSKTYCETTKPSLKFSYPVQAIYLILHPYKVGDISWGHSYEHACRMLGDEFFWGIIPTTNEFPACYTIRSYQIVIGTDTWFCADGSISYFNIPAYYCPDIATCPDASWTLSADKSICTRKDLPCVPDPANVSEEQLLAAIVYGESHWSNVYEEMAAIASATVRTKEIRRYKTVNELILKRPTFSYATAHADNVKKKNQRYYNVMCSVNSKGIDLAYKAAQNALSHGVDYSNGACFWDGLDLKVNGTKAFRYTQSFKISNKEHNVLSVIEPPIFEKKGPNKRFYHFKYVSTAGVGKTIFWKLSDEFIAAGGIQCF